MNSCLLADRREDPNTVLLLKSITLHLGILAQLTQFKVIFPYKFHPVMGLQMQHPCVQYNYKLMSLAFELSFVKMNYILTNNCQKLLPAKRVTLNELH